MSGALLFSHMIGGGIGGGLTLTLGFGSIFSRHTRSGMFLVVPGLLTGRGDPTMEKKWAVDVA